MATRTVTRRALLRRGAILGAGLALLGLPALGGCRRAASPPEDLPTEAITFPMEDKTAPANRFLYLTAWSFQTGTPEACIPYANLARELGFDGVGFVATWDRIQPTRDTFDWSWLDACLDYLTRDGLQLSLGLMFWTSALPWADTLCLQQTPEGSVFQFDALRGGLLCLNDAENLRLVETAMRAFVEHTHARYGAYADGGRIRRYAAHFSAFGEVEYTPSDIAIDYSPSEQAAFRAWLRERPGGLEALQRDYGLPLARWDDLDAIPVAEIARMAPYDWQHFRQETLIAVNRLVARATRASAPRVPLAMQVGSVWDYLAATRRGVFDGYLISRDVDVLHIDDAPGWPHRFSSDMAESLAVGRLLAQEIDGAQHADALPDLYLRQAEQVASSSVTILNTANWTPAQLQLWAEPLLSRYKAILTETPVRPLGPQDRALWHNTADFLTRPVPGPQDAVLLGAYDRLTDQGAVRGRFVSDGVLLANPSLLRELTGGLYLGSGSAFRLDPRVARLLAEARVPLVVEGPGLPSLSDPFGHPLEASIERRLRALLRAEG